MSSGSFGGGSDSEIGRCSEEPLNGDYGLRSGVLRSVADSHTASVPRVFPSTSGVSLRPVASDMERPHRNGLLVIPTKPK